MLRMYLAAPDYDLICLANMNDTQVLCNNTKQKASALQVSCNKLVFWITELRKNSDFSLTLFCLERKCGITKLLLPPDF